MRTRRPADWLPAMSDDLVARGALLGYAPAETAALRHFGFDLF